MKLKLPWLISRRKLIFSALLETLLIYFLNHYLFSKLFGFFESINLFTLCFLPFWLLLSYIFGRYSFDSSSFKRTRIVLFLRLFSNTLVVSVISLIIVFLISLNINLNNYNHFDKIILFYSSSISFLLNLIQFPLILRMYKNSIKENKWLFIGDKKLSQFIKQELKYSRKRISLDFLDINEDTIKINKNEIEGILIDNLEDFNDYKISKLLFLRNSGIKIITLENLCENYLQRFPPEILKKEYLIKGNFNIPQKSFQSRIKRIGDVLLSILLLIITSPIILISCILIFLEDRKFFIYKQERVGISQNIFTIYKLRTMKINSESGKPVWATKYDKRITKIGRILRKYRIDELPQLICVIRGDMSLIGPRPEREEIDKKLSEIIPHYNTRYLVRPGLSGWAQVNYPYGASVDDTRKKLSYDLFYLRNFSTWLDFLILLKTIRLVLLKKGAIPNK